ncbi:MAG: serine hydrolase [Oscillospiraceae bacterium]|nr:serine hydrolase [Oscillospiraceae bacterium]
MKAKRLTMRFLCFLFAVLLPVNVAPQAAAEEAASARRFRTSFSYTGFPDTAEEIVEGFREKYGLDETNFSIAYCCPETGETFFFNVDEFMKAGSTYKLPLNMLWYDLERAGVYAPDTEIGGILLSEAHYRSMVLSENEISEDMLFALGDFEHFKREILNRYGGLSYKEIPSRYWRSNYLSAAFMLNTLQVLYDGQEDYEELLELMEEAQPGEYMRKYAGSVKVAHKYGWYDEYVHDVGITFTEQPFLLVVFTCGVEGYGVAEELIGRLNAALIAYQRIMLNHEKRTGAEN